MNWRGTESGKFLRTAAIVLAFLFGVLGVAWGGTLTGTVRNGTTGKPAAGADVILIQLQGGMQPVATVKTDAQGRFKFDHPGLGAGPMLVRAVYKGVNYHEPATPGKDNIEVMVYEPTQDAKSFGVGTRAIVLQPKDNLLVVGEEYSVENHTQPPMAFFRAEGTFQFNVPDGAQLNQVSAAGANGMPVVQGTIDKGKNTEAIAFAFRPGDSNVRLSYQMPYPSNHAVIHNVAAYDAARVVLVAPPTVQVTSAGFTPAGTDQGYNIYSRDAVAAGTVLEISVSGTAPPESAGGTGGNGQDANASGGVNSRTEAPAAEATQVLPRMDNSVKWILVGGFVLLFLLGGAFLWRMPQQRALAGAGAPSVPVPVSYAPAPAPSPLLAEADRAVRGSLDEIKDNLFRLELRRQAGTISEEDYARQRGQAEKILRDLVRG